ncbi:hypothetical protein ACIA6C_27825 [Streptomyces sp. NPDC051578]|uniref:hypothetical protein n=1 Tax=Streptomyces sp. NPDC051578 TaxID=3365662 RepID=UPI0037A24F95
MSDELTRLQAKLEKYVGKEPTLREEMAYLNRCLNAVFEVCREAEKQATRWENPLPVPEWVSMVRKAAAGEREDQPDDRRRRLYLDGEGSVWVDGSVTSDGTQWIGYVHPSGGQSTLDEVRARTGELHEIGRTW